VVTTRENKSGGRSRRLKGGKKGIKGPHNFGGGERKKSKAAMRGAGKTLKKN